MNDTKFFTRRIVLLIVAVLIVSVVAAFVIIGIRNGANQDAIDACSRLDGRIDDRDYSCTLPDGQIVDPVLWESNR